MANLTRSNIAYDLNISPHNYIVDYENYKYSVKYVFSSDLYKRKFTEKLKENRETINTSLSNRFNLHFVCDILCDLKLYSTIEKRGFLIYVNGEKIDCLNTITLNGNSLTMRT